MIRRWKALLQLFPTPYHFQAVVDTELDRARAELSKAVSTSAKEVTQWISTEGYFVTDLASLAYGTPSRWNIQTLSDCEFYTISKQDYDNLKEVLPAWPEIEKRFLTKCFIILEERVHNQISLSAEERYNDLMQFNPILFNEVPLQYLASMLGMTPETRTCIRAKRTS